MGYMTLGYATSHNATLQFSMSYDMLCSVTLSNTPSNATLQCVTLSYRNICYVVLRYALMHLAMSPYHTLCCVVVL